MNRVRISFFLAGAVSGVTTALVGAKWPVVLAVGVGPAFLLALLAASSFAGAWKRVARSWQRWFIAAALSTAVYILSLFAFNLAAGYSPDLLNVLQSSDIVDFRGDVWVGLVAALLIASAGIELVAWVLVGYWSTRAFLALTIAGLTTVLLTYGATSMAHNYWSFFGVLFPLGQGSFCGLVGLQILKSE